MKYSNPKTGKVVVRAVVLAGLAATPAAAEVIYGVTSTQQLVSFSSAAPGTILTNVGISGLQAGETIRGIDFRPQTGGLYGLGSSNRLYLINQTTGAATQVGAGQFTPGLTAGSYGFDFNPTIDRIRVVGNDTQNTVLNPFTGGGTAATATFYAAGDPNQGTTPSIVGSAYDRNFLNGVTSQLYGIDSNLNILVRQANSAGTLTTVGALGVDFGNDVGFDITSFGTVFATNRVGALPQTHLFNIDLVTGQASLVGIVGGNLSLDAIAATPAPGSLGLLGLAGLAAGRRRR